MSLEMVLATSDDAIAQNILEGYEQTGGKGWSTIAFSAGRDWTSKENAALVAFFINKKDLGAKATVSGFTLIGRDDATEIETQKNMDSYISEESHELGTIAYWYKATHIHAWFDKLYRSFTGESLEGCMVMTSDVLLKLRDDCAAILDVYNSEGAQAAYKAMEDVFPLGCGNTLMFAAHEYTQKHIDDLEQTKVFLDYLFTLDGAFEARYAYDPWF